MRKLFCLTFNKSMTNIPILKVLIIRNDSDPYPFCAQAPGHTNGVIQKDFSISVPLEFRQYGQAFEIAKPWFGLFNGHAPNGYILSLKDKVGYTP